MGLQIGGWYSAGHTIIIAEVGANHANRLETACELVEAASRAGADAVKFQVYDENLYSALSAPDAREVARRYALPFDWLPVLAQRAHELSLAFIASAFSANAVAALEPYADAYKIASCEIGDYQLVKDVLGAASRRKIPIIISTGMSDATERWRVRVLCKHYRVPSALLACTSVYPCEVKDAPLGQMLALLSTGEDATVGLSDHTLSMGLPAVAVALGAQIIEKHMKLDAACAGPDAGHSIEPSAFAEMVYLVRGVEEALKQHGDGPNHAERASRMDWYKRSLHAARAIKKGQCITVSDIICQRPHDGDDPANLGEWTGAIAQRDYAVGEPLIPIGGSDGNVGNESAK